MQKLKRFLIKRTFLATNHLIGDRKNFQVSIIVIFSLTRDFLCSWEFKKILVLTKFQSKTGVF